MQAWMWRLTDEHAVIYTNDRPTLTAILAYARFPHQDLSRATTYEKQGRRVHAWQFTFPMAIWNGLVRHLGRSQVTFLDEGRPRAAAKEKPATMSPSSQAPRTADRRSQAAQEPVAAEGKRRESKSHGKLSPMPLTTPLDPPAKRAAKASAIVAETSPPTAPRPRSVSARSRIEPASAPAPAPTLAKQGLIVNEAIAAQAVEPRRERATSRAKADRSPSIATPSQSAPVPSVTPGRTAKSTRSRKAVAAPAEPALVTEVAVAAARLAAPEEARVRGTGRARVKKPELSQAEMEPVPSPGVLPAATAGRRRSGSPPGENTASPTAAPKEPIRRDTKRTPPTVAAPAAAPELPITRNSNGAPFAASTGKRRGAGGSAASLAATPVREIEKPRRGPRASGPIPVPIPPHPAGKPAGARRKAKADAEPALVASGRDEPGAGRRAGMAGRAKE